QGLEADCIAVRSGVCSGIRLGILRISNRERSDIDWERFDVETAVLAAESSVIAFRIEASKSFIPGSGAFCAWLIDRPAPARITAPHQGSRSRKPTTHANEGCDFEPAKCGYMARSQKAEVIPLRRKAR